MASTPELKPYTDQVIVRSQMCLYINFLLGTVSQLLTTNLANCDVKYQIENDQMQLIVKEVQALESITVIWLVGMDPVTTDYKDLADTLRENNYFKRLPMHVKIQ